VIPCLNEEETVGICIQKVQRAFAALGVEGEVVVADNGSTDRSIEVAREHGARVAIEPKRGYGAALDTGIRDARGAWIIMADADDSYDWSDIAPFLGALEDGADFVIGNRFKGGVMPGAMPPLHRYVGNPVLSLVGRLLFGVPIGDFHCGMRAFSKDAYLRMRLQTRGMEFASEMVVRCAWAGLRIKEIPIRLYPDKRSRPPHLRSFRDGWRHLRFLLTYAPNYTYIVPGLAAFGVGAMLCVALARGPLTIGGFFLGPHFVALGSMLAMLGFHTTALGIVAKVAIWRDMPVVDDRVVRWLTVHYALEWPMLVGNLLLLGGLLIDAVLAYRWIFVRQPMEDSVPVAFLATMLATLGASTVVHGMVLKILLDKRHDEPEV